MTITTLTTVAAFACLGLARFEGVRDVGLVGSVGLAVCLLASLHLIPLCYRPASVKDH
jgi:predicted exporter